MCCSTLQIRTIKRISHTPRDLTRVIVDDDPPHTLRLRFAVTLDQRARTLGMTGYRPIIVAESDFLTGTLLIASFEAAGRRALIARDGEAVLHLIEAHKPQLLVLSMNLARPGGVQMLRTLRQKNLGVKILATTRIGQAKLRATARTLGVSAFLELPFSPHDLNEQVERMLIAAS